MVSKILIDFLVGSLRNQVLFDRKPTEEEWDELIRKLKEKGLIGEKVIFT